MKRIFKFVAGILSMLCLIFSVGCGKAGTDPNAQNMTSSGTKSYYIKTGYVQIFVDKFFNVTGDIVNFDDGTVYAKTNKVISLSIADKNFDSANFPATNLSNKTFLSKVKINDEVFSVFDIDLNNIKVKNEISITPIISNFDVIGIALTQLDFDAKSFRNTLSDLDSNQEIMSLYGNKCILSEDFDDKNLSGFNFILNKSFGETNCFKFTLEIPEPISNFGGHLLLKDNDDNLFLQKLALDEADNNYYIKFDCNGKVYEIFVDTVPDISSSIL